MPEKTILFGTLGYPGSGKTYFARRFAKEFGLTLLNSDKIRSELIPKPLYTPQENKVVFAAKDIIAEELLRQGVSVMYDANLTKSEFRGRLRKIASRTGAQFCLLWIQTPIETALHRVEQRNKNIKMLKRHYNRQTPLEIIVQIKNKQELPTRESHVILDGTASYAKQRETVLNFLKAR